MTPRKQDIKVKVNIQSPIPTSFYTTELLCEKDAGRGLCIFTFTLYYTYLVCILFGVPFLHPFTFLRFFFYFLFLMLFFSYNVNSNVTLENIQGLIWLIRAIYGHDICKLLMSGYFLGDNLYAHWVTMLHEMRRSHSYHVSMCTVTQHWHNCLVFNMWHTWGVLCQIVNVSSNIDLCDTVIIVLIDVDCGSLTNPANGRNNTRTGSHLQL